ncbi:FtsK/SpoIIIE family protein [anaerobic digester metagenome]
MRTYYTQVSFLRFLAPSSKVILLGALTLGLSCIVFFLKLGLVHFSVIAAAYFEDLTFITTLITLLSKIGAILIISGIIVIVVAILCRIRMREADHIKVMVRKGLFYYAYGNPLHLKEGERLPTIKCKSLGLGQYELTLSVGSASFEDIQKLSSAISSCLNNKYERYAVTQTIGDLAFNTVSFLIDDVTVDRTLIVRHPSELKSDNPTLIPIQQGTSLDLTSSGSILVAGKTRSGKTTGVISMLISALLEGRDRHGSEIIIIDPKMAELSRLPHTYTLDDNGEAKAILEVMHRFEETIKKRQKLLNDLSEEKGDIIKWWDAGMHMSFIFIDEFIALKSLFPRKTKDNANYNIDLFDSTLKRIITMGASAGCFIIISIAEASVNEGGLPAMLRSAMSTKILFRPTMPEARLMWDGELLNDLNSGRKYCPGDAWFSSTDGENDIPKFVHFPQMEFPAYGELGRLLESYYKAM